MTDAQISHSANNAPSGPTAMQQNALKASCPGTGCPARSVYLQMKLLNDAGDQPGELIHINGIDESHGFLYAVGKEENRRAKMKLPQWNKKKKNVTLIKE